MQRVLKHVALAGLFLSIANNSSPSYASSVLTTGSVDSVVLVEDNSSDLLGKKIYIRSVSVNETSTTHREQGIKWEPVGEIDNLIVTLDGKLRAVILDIGQYLGGGMRRVAFPRARLTLTPVSRDNASFVVAINATRQQLAGMISFSELTAEERSKIYLPGPMSD